MRNKVKIFLLVIMAFTFSACSSDQRISVVDSQMTGIGGTNDSVQNSEVDIVELPQNTMPPAQPILFNTLMDSISFIINPDMMDYYKGYHDAYWAMVSSFQSDGYITTVIHNEASRLDDTVALYPEAKYEDIGVHYVFLFNHDVYQVVIYNTKDGDDYLIDVETETVVDYYEKRWNRIFSITHSEHVNHTLLSEVFLREMADGRICAEAMLDDSHYVVVRAKRENVDDSEIIAFIEGLEFVPVIIE